MNKKIGILIMSMISMLYLQGCTETGRQTAREVCDVLESRYDETFTATQIGGRWNTDSAKVFVHPDNNEELMFTAVINQNTREVKDDYFVQMVNDIINKALEHNFAENHIQGTARSYVAYDDAYQYAERNESPEKLQEACGLEYYVTYIILDSEQEPEDVKEIIRKTCEEQRITMIAVVFDLPSDEYEACRSAMKKNPEMNETLIKRYDPEQIYQITIDEGQADLVIEKD